MLDYVLETTMALASQSALTEAIASARAGDRSHARELLSKLLRADSANPEYWIWMSSVVDSEREKIYCLESALKLDPSNRAARGLVIWARIPEPNSASAIKVAAAKRLRPSPGRRHRPAVRTVATHGADGARGSPSPPSTRSCCWPRRDPGSMLAPVTTATLTPAPPTISPTVTLTPIPLETRIQRTPIPQEFAGTPLAFFVESTPTPTQMLAMTPRPQYEAYAAGIAALQRGDFEQAAEYMQQVIDLEPSAKDAYFFLGEANRSLGFPGQAVRAFDQAVLLDSDFGPAYLGRARTVQALRPDTLAPDYTKAIESIRCSCRPMSSRPTSTPPSANGRWLTNSWETRSMPA
jgi:tetratricopeptide (TPR) repeat protein